MKNKYLNKTLKHFVIPGLLLLAVFFMRRIDIPQYKTESGMYYVKKVVDGDTIVVGSGERVRYIGINTPEIHHPKKPVEFYGKEAKNFNQNLVLNQWVKLEFDVEKRDKYGRLLAYVYKGDIFVNAELVKQGYAQVYTFPPNVKYYDLFVKLEKEARKNKLGLWAKKKR